MGEQRRRRSWLREAVIAELHRNGPAVDDKGRAMIVLAERMGHASSMSVGNIVRQLETEGNAIRVAAKNGEAPIDRDGQPSPFPRRTYRIALTDEFIATLPPLPVQPIEPLQVEEIETAEEIEISPIESVLEAVLTEPASVANAPAADDEFKVLEGLDLDVIGHAVLGVVVNTLNTAGKMMELRQELEATKVALVEAREVVNQLGADLKAERKHRGKIEDEAAALSLRVEELEDELKAANRPVRNNGWKNKVEVDGFTVLDRIIREVPTARG
jgi:hypothetical protein